MPPKAPAAPSRGRGRGRARGRGGSAGTTRASAAADAAMQDAPPLESTETPAPAETSSAGAAPVAQMVSSSDATPAATPAHSAAPTPAPSAAPKAPTRTGSIRKAAASATPGPSTRGAKKAVVPAPRAVRRSKEERETLEKAEQKRRADEARNALREQRRAGRGRGDFKSERGRGGKARGGFMGDRERGIREQVASGPFSAGQVSAEGSYRRRPGGGGYSGGGGGGGGGTRIKSEGGTYGSIHSIQAEDGGYISSDEDAGEEGPRQDIDVIDISDDEDHGGNRGMIPIRVSRVEHKEREKPISADTKTKETVADAGEEAEGIPTGKRTPSPTAMRKGKQRVRDVEVTGTQRKWKGAWSDSDDSEPEMRIKPEPTDDSTAISSSLMETDEVPIKESSSPDTRRKSAKSRARIHGLPTEAPADQTPEEKREWQRHHMDLELIREELGHLAIPAPKASQPATAEGEEATDAQGDIDMGDATDAADVRRQQEGKDGEQVVEDRRADRVYLFQFPPILPDLQISSNPRGVKKEAPPSPELSRRTKPNLTGDGTNNNTEAAPINLDDIPDISEATGVAAANSKENPVKVEDGNANVPASAGQSTYRDVPSGFVGKLRVHASGRTTLDWGGTSMQVGMGTDVQFLQDVMAARFFDPPEEKLEDIAGVGGKRKEVKKEDKDDEDKGPGGEVMGLGQVRGKFVVTPDWEEIVGQRI